MKNAASFAEDGQQQALPIGLLELAELDLGAAHLPRGQSPPPPPPDL